MNNDKASASKTRTNFEIVAIDDFSDETSAILKTWSKRFAAVTRYENGMNMEKPND